MANDVDQVFEALADPTRRQVLELLSAGPRRAGDIARTVGVSAPAMSRHLRVLLEAGMVDDRRPDGDARVRLFTLQPQRVEAAQAWLDQLQAHWSEQLGSFKRHVEKRRPS
jgi:DNA-binding transcriptional ArsR family regulator